MDIFIAQIRLRATEVFESADWPYFSSLVLAQTFVDAGAVKRLRGKWRECEPDCWVHEADPEGLDCPVISVNSRTTRPGAK
jgi:hypothetical protein